MWTPPDALPLTDEQRRALAEDLDPNPLR